MPGKITGDANAALMRRVLDGLLLDAMRQVDAHGGALYLVEPHDRVLCMEVGTGVPPRFAEPVARLRLPASAGSEPAGDPVVDAVRARRMVWIGPEQDLARRYPKAALVFPHRFAMAVVPLITGGTPCGALLLVWPPRRSARPGRTELARITAAGESLAWVVHRAAEAGLRPSARPRLLIPSGTEPTRPAAQTAAACVDRFPEGHCALDPDGRITFVDRRAAGLLGRSSAQLTGRRPWETVPWLKDPLYEHRYREAVFSQRPTSFTAVQPLGRALLFQLYPDPSGVSVRIVPARADRSARRDQPPGGTPDGAPGRLGTIHHLLYLASGLSEAVRVRDVVDLLADRFLLAFGAQAVALLVTDAGRMRVIGHRGFPDDVVALVDGTPLTSRTPGVLGLTAGVPSFFASREELRRSCPERAALPDGMAAWAFLPLIVSGRTIGACVFGYDRPHPFSAEEQGFFISLSSLIAQALDRARLYDARHRLAHGLQSSLMPQTLPCVPGLDVAARYLPAGHGMDIGGDFYDVIRTGTADVAAVIGDVEGHSVAASAHMGRVRTTTHAYAVAGSPPGEVLARTNRLLTEFDPALLTSCLYVHIDLARHRAHLATAGHCPPLLCRPGRRAEILGIPPGLLLGIEPTADYPTTEITFPTGSVLVLYTDGLVEAPGIDTDAVTAALTDTLSQRAGPLNALADRLIARAQPSNERTDDTALLLLRSTAAGGRGAA